NGEALTYLLYKAPAGMTVDASSGLVTWNPGVAAPAAANVILLVYDARGSRDVQQFTISVAGVNQAPVVTPLAATIEGKEGIALEIDIAAVDPEGDPLRFWADGLPGGAVFDPVAHALYWLPGAKAAGTYPDVRFTVSDGLHQVTVTTTLEIAP